jgi:ribosomal-protein-alanine N-acetyltransferase
MAPDELAALHALAFENTLRPWTANEFFVLLAQPATVFAALDGGFAIGRIAGPEAELLSIAVHPEARRRGLGRRLVAAFEAEAAARGAEEAFLEVAATNTAAWALYVRAGYTETHRRRGYYARPGAVPIDAIVLHKRLSPAPPAAKDSI